MQDFKNLKAKDIKYLFSWKFQISRLNSSTARFLHTLRHLTLNHHTRSSSLYDTLERLVCEKSVTKYIFSYNSFHTKHDGDIYFHVQQLLRKLGWLLQPYVPLFIPLPFHVLPQYIPFYEVRWNIKSKRIFWYTNLFSFFVLFVCLFVCLFLFLFFVLLFFGFYFYFFIALCVAVFLLFFWFVCFCCCCYFVALFAILLFIVFVAVIFFVNIFLIFLFSVSCDLFLLPGIGCFDPRQKLPHNLQIVKC